MIRRSTWIVLVVLAVLLGLTWYLQARNTENAAETTPTVEPSSFLDLDTNLVASLRIIGPQGNAFLAERDENANWTLLEPARSSPLESTVVESNLSQLVHMDTGSSLEMPPPLEAVGLVVPEYVIELTLVDGRVHRLEVGNETPSGSGYYTRVDNSEMIVAGKFAMQAVFGMVDDLPLVPTPTPEFTLTPEATTEVNE
jgi:hypothetical protein